MIRIFNVYVPPAVVALLLTELVLIFTCLFVAAAWRLNADPIVFFFEDAGFTQASIVAASLLLGLYFQDLYASFRVRSRVILLQQVSIAIGISLVLQALLSFIDPSLVLPRWVMLAGCGLVLVLLPLWRWGYSAAVSQSVTAERVLFLGDNATSLEIASYLRRYPEMGGYCLGFVGANGQSAAAPALGSLADLRRVVRETQPDRIVVGLTEDRAQLPTKDLLDFHQRGIRVHSAAKAYETAFGCVTIRELRPEDVLFSRLDNSIHRTTQMQRLYSVFLAAVLLILTAPLQAMIALALRLGSNGPVLDRESRIGQGGRPFSLLRFRANRYSWLRRFHLTALPKLWNVLRGDMAIVGPRPDHTEYWDALNRRIPFYAQRMLTKPGITGWAQIRLGSPDSAAEDSITSLEYDLYYMKNRSIPLDAYILFSTAKSLFRAVER